MTNVTNIAYSNVFTDVVNPIYSKADNSTVDCQVTNASGKVFQFTAASFDVMSYGVALFNDLVAGVYGTISAFVPPSSGSGGS